MSNISVIIPTYKRPDMLDVVIRSIAEQSLTPMEILVGDDGPGQEGKFVVEKWRPNAPCDIRYFPHTPPLKQAGNVHHLIQNAKGKYLSLIHDDDWFLPNALEDLLTVHQQNENLSAVYGKQLIATHEGEINATVSEEHNQIYRRSVENEGIQDDSIVAAITQQFPNNAWLIKTAQAQKIDCARLPKTFANAVDFGFGLRYAQLQAGEFYFLNKMVAVYRISENSVGRNADANSAYYSFKAIYSDPQFDKSKPEIKEWLQRKIKAAISLALVHGTRDEAKQWLWSEYHRPSLLSLGGLKRIMKVYLDRH